MALVTGAGQGIGLGIARALAAAGLKVALADVDGEPAAAVGRRTWPAEGRDAIGLPLDVTRADDWARAVAEVAGRWGRLDVLVNNAGISPRGTVESTDEALWDRTLAINLKGPWLGIKAALPWLDADAGDDRQHRLDPGDPADAGPLPLRHEQGRACSGLTRQVAVECLDDGRDLQHGRPRLGRHARRARHPGRARPARLPRRASRT